MIAAPLYLQEVVAILKAMTDVELVLAQYYETCAQVWKEEEAFWRRFAEEEKQHALVVGQITKIVTNRPERYEYSRDFNLTAIHNFMGYVKQMEEQVKAKLVPHRKMLILARDMEQSLIEAKFFEIAKTNDLRYNELLGRLQGETTGHRNRFDQKLAELSLA